MHMHMHMHMHMYMCMHMCMCHMHVHLHVHVHVCCMGELVWGEPRHVRKKKAGFGENTPRTQSIACIQCSVATVPAVEPPSGFNSL